MSDLEADLRRVFRDKEPEAPAVKELSEYLGPSRASSRRWQWVAVPAAVVVTAAVVVGVAALSNQQGSPTTVMADPSSPVVGGEQREGPLFGRDAAVSCVEGYSPQAVTGRAFAFDGTVADIGEGTTNREGVGKVPLAAVTFDVNEWFLGGAGSQVTVDMARPSAGATEDEMGANYDVGTRLLVSGEPRWGGLDPTEDGIAWGCGFSRYWDTQTADAWRASANAWIGSLRRHQCWRTGETFIGMFEHAGGVAPSASADDDAPLRRTAEAVTGNGLADRFPDLSLVLAESGDVTQEIWVLSRDHIVGEFEYSLGALGWQKDKEQFCSTGD